MTNGGLGALKEDEHDQDDKNKVGPTFDDDHWEENKYKHYN